MSAAETQVNGPHVERPGLAEKLALAGICVVALVLLLVSLDEHYFWSDEAITAFYSRSVFSFGHGLPQAWDGRNLLAFGGGQWLNRNMMPSGYPLLQFYVAGPLFALFDAAHATFAGRLPFALIGLGTVPLTYLMARRWGQDRRVALVAALLLATSVQFLLFCRQCRYYSLTSLFSVLLLCLYPRQSLRRPGLLAAFIVCGLLLFQSHFMVFYAFMAGLALAHFSADRSAERLKPLMVAAVVMLAVTIPYSLFLVPATKSAGGGRSIAQNAALVWWYLRDMNRAALFPVLALPLLGVSLVAHKGERPRLNRPLAFMTVLVLAQVLFTAVVAPPLAGSSEDADLRYVYNLVPVLCLMLAMIWERVRTWNLWVSLALLGMLVFSNLLTLTAPRCFLYDYVYELTHDYQTNTERVAAIMAKEIQPDAVVLVVPSHQRDPLIFYLGDRFRFAAVLPPDDKKILPIQGDRLPPYIYSGDIMPDWIVMYGNRMSEVREDISANLERTRADFDVILTDIYYQDTNRPELIWHSFHAPPRTGIPPKNLVTLLRRVPTRAAQ